MLEHTPDVLTIPEAAETLKLSVSAIQSLVDNGEIEHLEIAGQTLIFKLFLVNYIEKLRKACYTEIADASKAPQGHLDNCTGQDIPPFSEGDAEMAKYKINQPVMINGEKRWITANSMQEVADKITKLLGTPQDRGKHPFEEYAWNWFETYSKPNIEAATAITYERQIRLHLIPAFSKAIEDITVDDVQRLFNSMEGTAKTTKDKARMVLNQILNSAVEDQIIEKNPLNSNRLKITGEPSKPTEPYTVEQMRYLVKHLDDIKKPRDRAFLALVAFHPVRPEEAFGLAPEDIDRENMALHIRQAVTHPGRNQPILKDTKTYSRVVRERLRCPLLHSPIFSFPRRDHTSWAGNALCRVCKYVGCANGFSVTQVSAIISLRAAFEQQSSPICTIRRRILNWPRQLRGTPRRP